MSGKQHTSLQNSTNLKQTNQVLICLI